MDWARGPLAKLFEGSLTDLRVTLHQADVAELIAPARSRYDAILLDVDNGPGGLNRAANDGLYAVDGLLAARRALAPGGVLAVWSAGPNAEFAKRLHRTGFRVDEVRVRARGAGRGARHVIWIAAPA
jgi:spermidine synthase